MRADQLHDDKIEDITEQEQNSKPVKTSIEDIVIIEDKPKKDDDKETVDLFMEDLQKMDNKQEVVMDKIEENKPDKSDNSFILFDDLN